MDTVLKTFGAIASLIGVLLAMLTIKRHWLEIHKLEREVRCEKFSIAVIRQTRLFVANVLAGVERLVRPLHPNPMLCKVPQPDSCKHDLLKKYLERSFGAVEAEPVAIRSAHLYLPAASPIDDERVAECSGTYAVGVCKA